MQQDALSTSLLITKLHLQNCPRFSPGQNQAGFLSTKVNRTKPNMPIEMLTINSIVSHRRSPVSIDTCATPCRTLGLLAPGAGLRRQTAACISSGSGAGHVQWHSVGRLRFRLGIQVLCDARSCFLAMQNA